MLQDFKNHLLFKDEPIVTIIKNDSENEALKLTKLTLEDRLRSSEEELKE